MSGRFIPRDELSRRGRNAGRTQDVVDCRTVGQAFNSNERRISNWEHPSNSLGIGPRPHDMHHTYAPRALALGQSLPMLGALLAPCQVDTMGRRAHLAPVFAPSAVNFGMRRSRSRIRRSGNAAAAIRFIRLWPNACADLPELPTGPTEPLPFTLRSAAHNLETKRCLYGTWAKQGSLPQKKIPAILLE